MQANDKVENIIVLGGGESGAGGAVLAKVKGHRVLLSDSGNLAPRYKELLQQHDIEFEEGGHTVERVMQATLAIKSPGIPSDAPLVVALRQKGVPVISEIEFASRYTDAKMVCITGSNGKTTTTLLTYHILKDAGLNVGLAGNVGRSLALQVATESHDVYVIELSSFQLDDMYDFRANIAVMMNITPDHLDRYDYKFENYVKAKFRILQNQTPTDAFIYCHDDPVIKAQLEKISVVARQYPFAEHEGDNVAAYVDPDDQLVINTSGTSLTMPRADLALNGLHNLFNSMAAGLSASVLNIAKEDIRRALSDFEGVEHRLEYVDTVNGVRYINDSKATNVNSCWYALESMPRNVVLILGGKDKGNDYSEILPLVKEKVKAIVAMGKDNTKIIDYFGSTVKVVDTHYINEAIDSCAAIAVEGDTVLLSPCCASFDLFKSYEHRGKLFKEQVARLKAGK
ncbi:MAG: UDP-N-acetylmuramoyl-L-alanine--D-glutamate ligase [Muribaculaceae bacterium]|nr:UDP-N-acetylmuramoyl-L-alanine--D-glutamate ligase [Muribaculaceae bacterium]